MSIKGLKINSKKTLFALIISLGIFLAGVFFWQMAITVRAKIYYKEVEINKEKQEYIERVGEILKAKQEQETNVISDK